MLYCTEHAESKLLPPLTRTELWQQIFDRDPDFAESVASCGVDKSKLAQEISDIYDILSKHI